MGSGIFALGARAMTASQAMLDTVAHNISNVNTPGYSRQETQLATATGQFTGAGFFGRGVQVVTVSRSTNEFLTKAANFNASSASSDQTRLDKLTQLEQTLPTGTAGLGYAASQFLNGFVDVANQPQDVSARQVALSRAQEFVSRVNTAGKQLDDMQMGVVSDTQTGVDQINAITKQLADINQNITQFQGSGQQPNDLLDKRDLLIKNLNQLVQVTTVPANDGSLSVFMGGGQELVLGNQAQTLSMVRDPTDTSQARVALHTSSGDRIIPSDQITGGSLHGLQTFQDQDITAIRAQLNTFVSQFTTQVNAQQQLGLDSQGNPASTAIFANTGSATALTLNLNQPGGIGAASPLVATLAATNTGTASIDRLATTGNALNGSFTPPATITFVADATAASGLSYQISPSGTTQAWVPGTALSDPSNSAFNLSLNGVPKAGDIVTVAKTAYPGSNNGNALAMLNLRDNLKITLDGGVSSANVTDTYSQMIGNLGVMVQSGQTTSDISTALSNTSNQTLASSTGVNLDEEAARLIQYQQSYQAAAKILQVAQTVFDTLLNTAR